MHSRGTKLKCFGSRADIRRIRDLDRTEIPAMYRAVALMCVQIRLPKDVLVLKAYTNGSAKDT